MIDMELRGIEDVKNVLEMIAPRQAQNIMRATVHGIAGKIRNDARSFSGVDDGVLKKAIGAKRERTSYGQLMSTVRVAPQAFYWRFEEYGQGPSGKEVAMFGKSVAIFTANKDQIFIQEFGKKFEAALARARKRQSNGN